MRLYQSSFWPKQNMVTLAIRYGTRFSSSHSHTFWQYGHHAWLSLYRVTRTDASGCPKVRTSACECVGPVAWSGGTYDAANGASSDQLSAARLARFAAFGWAAFKWPCLRGKATR